jgi:hypothetical protein
MIREAGIDALEIHNAGALTPGNNLLARRLAALTGLPVVGNSDAHSPQAIGRGFTCFPGRSADDFRRAVLSGSTRVEGRSWPPGDYLRLFSNLVQNKLQTLGFNPR